MSGDLILDLNGLFLGNLSVCSKQVLYYTLIFLEPLMIQGLVGARAILRICIDHLDDKVLAKLRIAAEVKRHVSEIASPVLIEDLSIVGPLKQIQPCQEIKEDCTCTEDVTLVCVPLAPQNLRCYIPRSPALNV